MVFHYRLWQDIEGSSLCYTVAYFKLGGGMNKRSAFPAVEVWVFPGFQVIQSAFLQPADQDRAGPFVQGICISDRDL